MYTDKQWHKQELRGTLDKYTSQALPPLPIPSFPSLPFIPPSYYNPNPLIPLPSLPPDYNG